METKNEFVKYEQDNFVAIVTIDRPKALNALNSKVLEELSDTFDNIDLQKTRAVILTGAGEKSFVAGADISEMFNLTEQEGFAFGQKGNDVFRKIELFPIPVIAVINGFALGGGCELASACDIRLCSKNALFGQPEVGLGITPGFGGTQRLSRLVGLGKAKELILVGRNIDADEAYRIGLVNNIYDDVESLRVAALKMAQTIAKNAPIAVRNSKKAINDGYNTDIDRGLTIEEHLFAKCFSSSDQKEGMSAFLEKRKEKNFLNK